MRAEYRRQSDPRSDEDHPGSGPSGQRTQPIIYMVRGSPHTLCRIGPSIPGAHDSELLLGCISQVVLACNNITFALC